MLTLDAGGTSFRFNAIQGGRLLLDPIRVPTAGADLAACLDQLVAGFEAVLRAVGGEAVALSFAFPGPADYAAGIIGDLPNLSGFRGGVPLGPMLEARFGLPVFVNNDGALFTYGEALGGLLPWANDALAAAGSARRYHNLVGFTLGTGFGGGLVVDGRLVRGDTSTAAQVWKLRHRDLRRCFVEEGVSIRAVRRAYAEATGISPEAAPEPREIGAIAEGRARGDAAAARAAFEAMGRVAGDAIAQVLTVIDGLAVLGGGLSAAAPLFLPALLAEVNGTLEWHDGRPTPRLLMSACDLTGLQGARALLGGPPALLPVRGASHTVPYDPVKRTGVGVTRLGTTEATALGAYAFALERLRVEAGR